MKPSLRPLAKAARHRRPQWCRRPQRGSLTCLRTADQDWLATILLAGMLLLLPIQLPAQEVPPERKDQLLTQLQEAKILPTPAGLTEFLTSLVPSESQRQVVQRLLDELSATDYQLREQATRRLISLPAVSDTDLQDAETEGDSEVLWRIKTIRMARREGSLEKDVRLCLNYIAAAQLPEMLPSIRIAVLELGHRPLVRASAYQAMLGTLQQATPEALASWSSAPEPILRSLALQVIRELADKEDLLQHSYQSTLDRLLVEQRDDPSLEVRYQIAEALARRQNRDSLRLLIMLLEDAMAKSPADPSTRSAPSDTTLIAERASRLLRTTTDQSFGFSSYAPRKQQLAAIAEWKKWIEEQGTSARLLPPQRKVYYGRTLISLYSPGRVVELNEQGEVVWERDLASAFACVGLENGHRLIAQYAEGRIVEFDVAGNVAWEVEGLPNNLSGISRTEDGTTLVAAGQADNALFEIARDKTRVWETKVEGTPVHAVRLPNGLTMVTLMNRKKIVEIDREGNELWTLELKEQPYHAQRLENGNTLIRLSRGGVQEYTRDGQLVWEAECSNGYSVQRLDDGTTLIAEREGFRVVNREGETVEENRQYSGYLYINRY